MLALIDADIVAYRAAAACETESLQTAIRTTDSVLVDALLFCDYEDRFYDKWKLFLTGKDNFRYDIAKTAVYKGNRTGPKPKHLQGVRKHMVDEWGAVICDGQEADDAIAIEATKNKDRSVIISLDKDFKQIAGHLFLFVKKQHLFFSEEQAIRFFYMQILMGDKADNIMGIDGIGIVKSEKMLIDCANEVEMFNVCVEAYDGNVDRVIENARLLWLRREEGQIWNPPKSE